MWPADYRRLCAGQIGKALEPQFLIDYIAREHRVSRRPRRFPQSRRSPDVCTSRSKDRPRLPHSGKNEGLGDRHIRIMRFLTDFQEMHGYSPSIREIGKHISVDSTSLVDYYLEQLCQASYIERDKRVSRSIRILRPVYQGDSVTTSTTRPSQTTRAVFQRISELSFPPVR